MLNARQEKIQPAEFRSSWKPIKLNVFTGASAGNINAIIGSIDWCNASLVERPEDSLLFHVWTRTGIEELMPYQFPNDPGARDALFTRDIFEATFKSRSAPSKLYATHLELLDEAMARGSVAKPQRGACSVDLGLTMTALAPVRVPVSSESQLETPVSRVAAVLRISGLADGPLHFTQQRDIDDEDARRQLGVIAYQTANKDSVPVPITSQAALRVASASSAFPIAFSPVPVPTFTVDGSERTISGDVPKYLDGGVFDNHPTALALLLQRNYHRGGPVLYVDDGVAREGVKDPVPTSRRIRESDPKLKGPKAAAHALMGMLDSMRHSERQAMWRYFPRNELDRLSVNSRYSNLVGEQLGAFGAFLGRPFREHDFYVGVYDGLNSVARQYVCKDSIKADDAQAGVTGRSKQSECVQATIENLRDQLELRGTVAGEFIDLLMLSEFQEGPAKASAEAARRIRAKDAPREAILLKILSVLLEQYHRGGTAAGDVAVDCTQGSMLAKGACKQGLTEVLNAIHNDAEIHPLILQYKAAYDPPLVITGQSQKGECPSWGRPPQESEMWTDGLRRRDTCFLDETFLALVDDPVRTFDVLTQRISVQLWRVANNKGEGWEQLADVGAALAEWYEVGATSGFHLHPTIAPNYGPGTRLADVASWVNRRLVPDTLLANATVGGVEVGYRPTYFCGPDGQFLCPKDLAYQVSYLPYAGSSSGKDQFDLWGIGPALSYRTRSLKMDSVDLGVQWLQSYSNSSQQAMSVELAANIVLGRMRLGFRYTRADDHGWEGPEHLSFLVGINDLPGFAYWVSRSWRQSQ